jgi:hypothetical protein
VTVPRAAAVVIIFTLGRRTMLMSAAPEYPWLKQSPAPADAVACRVKSAGAHLLSSRGHAYVTFEGLGTAGMATSQGTRCKLSAKGMTQPLSRFTHCAEGVPPLEGRLVTF